MDVKPPDQIGLFEALYSTRALRRFTDQPVPDEVLFQVVDAAIRAPAGGNMQIWHFLVVRDEAKRKRIGELYWQTWTEYGTQYVDDPSAIDELPPQMRQVVRSTDHLARNIASAPVHLFVCGPENSQGTIYPAVQNVALACRGLGLGTVITGFHRRWDAEIRELLGIPEGQVPHALMPIGYPSDKIGPVGRRPVRKAASLDTWGEPWPFAAEQPEEGWRDRWIEA